MHAAEPSNGDAMKKAAKEILKMTAKDVRNDVPSIKTVFLIIIITAAQVGLGFYAATQWKEINIWLIIFGMCVLVNASLIFGIRKLREEFDQYKRDMLVEEDDKDS